MVKESKLHFPAAVGVEFRKHSLFETFYISNQGGQSFSGVFSEEEEELKINSWYWWFIW